MQASELAKNRKNRHTKRQVAGTFDLNTMSPK